MGTTLIVILLVLILGGGFVLKLLGLALGLIFSILGGAVILVIVLVYAFGGG